MAEPTVLPAVDVIGYSPTRYQDTPWYQDNYGSSPFGSADTDSGGDGEDSTGAFVAPYVLPEIVVTGDIAVKKTPKPLGPPRVGPGDLLALQNAMRGAIAGILWPSEIADETDAMSQVPVSHPLTPSTVADFVELPQPAIEVVPGYDPLLDDAPVVLEEVVISAPYAIPSTAIDYFDRVYYDAPDAIARPAPWPDIQPYHSPSYPSENPPPRSPEATSLISPLPASLSVPLREPMAIPMPAPSGTPSLPMNLPSMPGDFYPTPSTPIIGDPITLMPEFPAPSPSPTLTPLDTLSIPESTLDDVPFPLPAGVCPPCEGEKTESKKKEKRNVCYVKLVKERSDPTKDTTRQWRKIKCQ